MINVTAPLWLWAGENGSWHFITVPEEFSGEIRAHAMAALRGFGPVRGEATIHDVTWRTSVFPVKSGSCIPRVKADVGARPGSLRKTRWR